MIKEGRPHLKIANPHGEGISVDLLIRILRQAGISLKASGSLAYQETQVLSSLRQIRFLFPCSPQKLGA